MSTRIKLHFSKALDLELFESKIEVWLRRVSVQVCFKTPQGWSQPYEAILDTGAPVSILPPAIWQENEQEILAENHKIQGIVPDKNSYLRVKIANISCVLMDEKNISEVLKVKAYLAHEAKTPLVLGFENLISISRLFVDPQRSEGYIEI